MSRHAILLIFMITLILSTTPIFTSPDHFLVDNNAVASWPGGLIIDHSCIDLESIPSEWITSAQDALKIHYAHTSHGSQITTGLTLLESVNSTFDVAIGDKILPPDTDSLCILDGNPPHDYITPELYWQGTSARVITQNTIDDNPSLTISLWSWCCQLYDYSEAQTQEYLDAMTLLETTNSDITFIYMTCNAQASDEIGYNRWLRNEQIRQYCINNDKILFDFADLDCWSNGEHSTYGYVVGEEALQIPVEHPDFNGDEAGHTTLTSCEQKGRAFWWLMAMLAGWNVPEPSTSTSTTTSTTSHTDSTTGQLPLGDLVIYSALASAGLLVLYLLVRRRYS